MSETDLRPQDAKTSFVDHIVPLALRPYARLARLDRPVGWQLLLIPCLWSQALAALAVNRAPSLYSILLFTLGAIAMRGAGSTWNDFLDRDIDRQVERTRNRPLAVGTVAPRQALAFIAVQCLIGLLVLVQFNWFAIGVGVASLGLVALYPLAKRYISHPQIVLGAVFSWGALMGWAGMIGSLSLAPSLLYFATMAWIIGYDTIYAMQDIEDDAMIGIGSTARVYGHHALWFVGICYAVAMISFGAALWLVTPNWLARCSVLLLAAGLILQLSRLAQAGVPAPAPVALALFKSNAMLGAAVAAMLLLGAVF